MGKYTGILLLTDFDGTLYTGSQIPQNNIDAIKRFCSEGGLFGFASGRTYKYFRKWDDIILPNTCISSVNGTVIYDYPSKKVVSERFMRGDSFDKILQICRDHPHYINITVFRRYSVIELDFEAPDFAQKLAELMSEPVHKVMFHSRFPIGDDESADMQSFVGEDYYVSRSWKTGIEIQSSDSTKGVSARQIKAFTGADLLVCAGDYENDVTMIEAADIGYAVANAIDGVKKVADRHTVRVDEGAIAAIIDELGSV